MTRITIIMLFGIGDRHEGQHWYQREESGQFTVVPRAPLFPSNMSDLAYYEYRFKKCNLTNYVVIYLTYYVHSFLQMI